MRKTAALAARPGRLRRRRERCGTSRRPRGGAGERAARQAEVGPPSTPVLLTCRSGRGSGIAAEVLAGLGFSSVWDGRTYQA